jgi:hypothetical protein
MLTPYGYLAFCHAVAKSKVVKPQHSTHLIRPGQTISGKTAVVFAVAAAKNNSYRRLLR